MNPILTPFWSGDEVLRESFMPLREKDGSIAPIRLLYRADEILRVQSATLEKEYAPQTDYSLQNGCLVIPYGSAIPVMEYNDYYLEKEDPGRCFEHSVSGWIRFAERDYCHLRQTVVSYRHSDEWTGTIPENKLPLLPRTASLLQTRQPLRLLIFGDSISTGANASKTIGALPYQAPWFELLLEGLSDAYSTNGITLHNTSVGGKTGLWGRETAKENAAQLCPDLCVIGFGMNDGSGNVPNAEFIARLKAIMATVRAENPLCEFILIATTLPNREVKGFFGTQETYLSPMLALEQIGVCVADMTTVHRELLERKAFRDMTGNNVNHPNDFLSRVYAQVLLRTLGAL